MRESSHRSTFFGFVLPVLIVAFLALLALATMRTTISGAVSRAGDITVTHFFDSGVSVWNICLR